MNLFDILGPIMVGPSSSHTAGAVKIGYVARKLLGQRPTQAELQLHGSFAATGKGHGTDRALVAGLLGMQADDERIPQSFQLAQEQGLKFAFQTVQLRDVHPNSVRLNLTGTGGKQLEVVASSLGGGRIKVVDVDGIPTNFAVDYPTLVIRNQDSPGTIARVTTLLSEKKINVATMQLYRNTPGGEAVMVLEIDNALEEETVRLLENMPDILKVIYLDLN